MRSKLLPVHVAWLGLVGGRLALALAGCSGDTFGGGDVVDAGDGGDGGAAADGATTSEAGPAPDGDRFEADAGPFVDGSERTGIGCLDRALPAGATCVRFDDGGLASSYFLSVDSPGPSIDPSMFSSPAASARFTTETLADATAGGAIGALLRPTFARDVYLAFDLALPKRTGTYFAPLQLTWNDNHSVGYTLTFEMGPTGPISLTEAWTGGAAAPSSLAVTAADFPSTTFKRLEVAAFTSDGAAKRVVVRVAGVQVGSMQLTDNVDKLDFSTARFYVGLASAGAGGASGTWTANLDDVVVVPLR